MKTLTNEFLTIKVKPHGAELASIVCNKTGKEFLWQADPAFWKRHSPVLFPIVGSVWDNEYRNDGKTYSMSQHGFARDNDFDLVNENTSEILYRLTSNDETLKAYPFPFELQIGYKLTDNKIEVIWVVKNTGNSIMHFQIGAHPAFYYSDFDTEDDLRGYFSFDKSEGLEYRLISEKGCMPQEGNYPLELKDGLLPIGINTFDRNALIFEDSQIKTVRLLDKQKRSQIALHFTAPLVGLWAPVGKDAPFVCIEPWHGRCDRVNYSGEFKDKDWMNHLEAGEVFKTSYTIEVGE